MKKLLLALLMIFTALTLLSCGGNPTNPDDKPDKPDDPAAADTSYTLIVSDGSINLSDLINTMIAENKKNVAMRLNAEETDDKVILFGNVGQSASDEAIAVLDALLDDADEESFGYVIYKSKNGDISVVWSNPQIAPKALERFSESFISIEGLRGRAAGILANEILVIDDYLEETMWAAVTEQAPAEVVAALKKLNSFYDGSAIAEWMANLYDPFICACGKCDPESGELACYGGAFYYSNSARDYSGFLPDAESTVQLLRWMENNGALSDYSKALPDEVKANLIKFAQSLQDEGDGYFYHPQWGKNIATDRKGRDLGWATGILSTLGAKPLYPTATDRLQGKSTSAITSPLGLSVADAVSPVVPTASAFEESLKSEETYLAWLKDITNGDDMFINSAGAHTINASASQIKAAGYQEITLDYLDAQQEKLFKEQKATYDADPVNNPMPTGLWQRTADYNAVWGLLKFAALYNREIKYAEYGIRTCIAAIKIDANNGETYYMNDVYNQWQAATNLISNAKKYRPEIVPTLYELLNEDAVAMIENSINKVNKFKCEDGGFSYRMDMAPPKMYGSATALGVKESDVNGTSLACSMYRAVFTSLGYSAVPLCDFRDGEMFIDVISGATIIDKIERSSDDPITFDEKPTSMVESFNGGSASIVTDPKDGSNSVLQYVSEADATAGDSLTFEVYQEIGGNCFVFELDMMIESSAQKMPYQFRIGNKNSKNAYMFVIGVEDGKVKIYDNPTTSNTTNMQYLNAEANLGEWFHLRFEYYDDPTLPTIKFYFNGTLTAVSHNYFGSDKGSAPVHDYTEARLFALRAVDAVSYIDNAVFAKIVKEYVEESPES